MEEYKCLPGVMEKCPDCEGPECTYTKGSRCEEDNLSYLPPTLRQELMAYRDTGLTPEEIELMKEAQGIGEGMTPQRLAEILTADQAGRLVVLPCNVGDTVYLPLRDGIHGVRVKGIRIAASGKDTVLHLDIGAGEFRWGSDKGRTWFATRQEAEAAVEREEGQA